MSLMAVAEAHSRMIEAELDRDRAKQQLADARSRLTEARAARVSTMNAYVAQRGHAALREMSDITGLTLARVYALMFDYKK